jgi:hypothetical protein
MRLLWFLPALLCLATSAAAEPIRLELKAAAPAEVGQALERALQAPVEVRGGAGRRVTLTLSATSPPLILDRVTAQLGGTWRMKLRVRQAPPGTLFSPSPRPVVERNLSIGIQDLPASRAFALVARELGAELELEGSLEGRVSQPAANLPATVMLDRLAQQSSAAWSIRYVITAPDAPPVREPAERDIDPILTTPRTAPLPTPAKPLRIVPPPPASGKGLRDAIRADIANLLHADPSQREAAVREFVAIGEKRVATLDPLPPAERANRIRALRPVVLQWRRLYTGLAPDLKKQLRPAALFLEKTLR